MKSAWGTKPCTCWLPRRPSSYEPCNYSRFPRRYELYPVDCTEKMPQVQSSQSVTAFLPEEVRSSAAGSAGLPWILKGEPAGFENDIVTWSKPEDLTALLEPRISAMDRLSE